VGLKIKAKRLALEKRGQSYQDISFFGFEDQVVVLCLGCKVDDEGKRGGERLLGRLYRRGWSRGRGLGRGERLVEELGGGGGRRRGGRVDHGCCWSGVEIIDPSSLPPWTPTPRSNPSCISPEKYLVHLHLKLTPFDFLTLLQQSTRSHR
jgi:hypothetical protein